MKLLRMHSKSLAVPIAAHPHTASTEGGCVLTPGERETAGIAALDPFVNRDLRWCVNCGGEALFIECFECEFGRVGVCFGCGEEKLVEWSRTNSTEVA